MKRKKILIFITLILIVLISSLSIKNVLAVNINKINKVAVKYVPATKKELQALVDNYDISLADIDVSKITDMSYLFEENNRDYSGIESWDVGCIQCRKYGRYVL